MTVQGAAYTAFVESELTDEITRRTNINDHARTAITSAGAQFAIVTALVVFVKGADYAPAHAATLSYGAALVLYLVSVTAGLAATRTHKTPVAAPEFLEAMLDDHWTDDDTTARNIVARARIKQIVGLRQGNNIKTRWLKRSLAAQIAAILALTAAVIWTVL
jgi:hypothetical protein